MSAPLLPRGHLVAFPTHPVNQYSMLVNSKISTRNKKITSIVTNGLYLKVLLKLYLSFFIITCSLFPDYWPFWSNSVECTQSPQGCLPAGGTRRHPAHRLKELPRAPTRGLQGWALRRTPQPGLQHCMALPCVIASLLLL